MDAEALPSTKALEAANAAGYTLKPIKVGWRSRLVIFLMRWLLRPWLGWVMRGPPERIARTQLLISGRPCKDTSGLPLDYRVVGKVPGHVLGDLSETSKPVILYLHGGAFVLPAAPEQHVWLMGKLCRDTGAVGFMPDYRLGPSNKYPRALDDCEAAYRSLLELGFDAERIVLAGESAGGNLIFGLLQRIRKARLPMPCGIAAISPGADMGRLHGPRSRSAKASSDPILPIGALVSLAEHYIGDADTADPEISPLFADFSGFPPAYLIASENEILLDDTLMIARRMREAGVDVELDVWPVLPHAFPLLEVVLPEGRGAREDMVAFMKKHLSSA